jgi:hypothetical protein
VGGTAGGAAPLCPSSQFSAYSPARPSPSLPSAIKFTDRTMGAEEEEREREREREGERDSVDARWPSHGRRGGRERGGGGGEGCCRPLRLRVNSSVHLPTPHAHPADDGKPEPHTLHGLSPRQSQSVSKKGRHLWALTSMAACWKSRKRVANRLMPLWR